MAVFKRGRVYWYHFTFNDERVQESTKQGNRNVALTLQAAHRTALAKGELDIKERKPAPTLKAFAQQFLDNAGLGRKQEPKVSTKAFYADALNVMLKFEPLASAKMDSNLPELAKRFLKTTCAGPGRKNAYLRTLRRAAHVAQELGLVRSVPRFPMEQGEHEREFVLSPDQESAYLSAAPQPLRDAALLMLGTGLCVGEVCGLEW
jgi:hypothetical protein